MNNYDTRALADTQNGIIWSQYGEVLRLVDSSSVSMGYLTDVLKRPKYEARYRLFVFRFQSRILFEEVLSSFCCNAA